MAPRARPLAVALSVAAAHDAREEKAAVDYATRALAKTAAIVREADEKENTDDRKRIAESEQHGFKSLAEEARARIERRRAALTEPVLPGEAERHTWCKADRAGAWAIVELEVEYMPDPDRWREPWTRSSRLGVARIDAEGKLTTAGVMTFLGRFGSAIQPFARGEMNCCFSIYGGAPEATFTGDIDGDGVPEIAVGASVANEGSGEDWSALFRATPNGVATVAEGFAAMKDDTGDGLPDLEYREEFSAGIRCGSGFNRRGFGPTFIAHNRGDGTFSREDDEARAYARRACPKAPTAFDSSDAVVCARLWGVSQAAITAWIDAHVPEKDCVSDDDAVGQIELRNASKLSLPFTLGDAGAGKVTASPHPG